MNNKKTGFELKIENEEIVILTELIAENIAKSNEEFSDFLNWKEESDFICINFDSEKFLELIFDEPKYYEELATVVMNVLWFMKEINDNPKAKVPVKIRDYDVENRYVYIKFNTSDDKTIRCVKLDLYDIVWGILMFKNEVLFQILYREIISAPFI